MRKEAMVGIIFILMTCIMAGTAMSGCVTYAQARAQGVQGTDAELYKMGFCSGTAAQTAPAQTQTTTASKQTQTSPATTTKSATSTTQTSGSTMQQLRDAEYASSSQMYDGINKIYDSASDDFDYNAAIAISEKYSSLRNSYYDTYAAATQKIWGEQNPKCEDSCVTKAGINRAEGEGDYDLWRSCRDDCFKKATDAEIAAFKTYVDLAIQTHQNTLTEISQLAGTSGTTTGTTPSGPKVNQNSDRGRDVAGEIAASMGGYLGNAYVVQPDGTKVIPGKELYLQVDDKVVTGTEAKANIFFGNAGRMHLGPDTELRVGSAQLDQYYLMKGTLKTDLKLPDGKNLKILTSNAKITMKGTDFVTEYNDTTNSTTVYLNEGSLEIESDTQTLNLTAGNYCTISANGTITSSQMKDEDWKSLGSSFYDESLALGEKVAKIYLWITLAVMIIATVLSRVLVKRAAKHPHKDGKNLGPRSIVLGVLGLLAFLLPIIGYPLSAASVTYARIQKLRKPTISAKIGLAIGISGVFLNGVI
ncbi:FecR domain-containing protein, partial [Candidatus Woesearchaeota archaeon]|nr:FecR domain-containing protein [Candidatus Woesearchaeota archaeon]